MTALGLALGGRIYPFQTENPLTILAFFADIGNGLLYLLPRPARRDRRPEAGDVRIRNRVLGRGGASEFPRRPRCYDIAAGTKS